MSWKKEIRRGDATVVVAVRPVGDGQYHVQVGSTNQVVAARRAPDGSVHFEWNGHHHRALCAESGKGFQVRIDHHTWLLEAQAARSRGSGVGAGGAVEAPMTGTILKVLCSNGDSVEPGQTLIVLTAMKMEHKLTAGIAGKVTELVAVAGQNVEQGTVLARVLPTSADQP